MMPTSQALILTENKRLDQFLTETLEACGIEGTSAFSIAAAWHQIDVAAPDLVLTDLSLKQADPLEFVAGLLGLEPAPQVVVLARKETMARARQALELGAATYLRAPVEQWEVERTLGELFHGAHRSDQGSKKSLDLKVYGSSPAVQAALKIVEQVARRDDHLLLVGEPGSGKRRFGRLIHNESKRAAGRFLSLNCAGLSESLVERELFGYKSQNADGMRERHQGYFELCNRGTLLLDEVGELPRRLQEKVLKCMSRKSFQSPGAPSRAADVRVIGTSSQNLEEKVASGRLLRELYECLQSICITVPSLRDRRSDIPVLVDQYVRAVAESTGKNLRGVAPSVLEHLMRYDWPGNVRELKDIVTHAASSARGPMLGEEDLPSLPEPLGTSSHPLIPGATIQEIEKDAILRTLEAAGGSTSRAARILDMSVRKIQYKLKEYRMDAASASRVERVASVASPPRQRMIPKKAAIVSSRGS
jgi:DNA-binding NtrC family response regulator